MRHQKPAALKAERQSFLVDIVLSHRAVTQSYLVERLRHAGIPCTQASVSRDIKELGLIKRGGRYTVPESATAVPDMGAYAANIGSFLRRLSVVGDHLVVIHTLPGTAHSVALYIDGVHWKGVEGTVAGDDTVFAAVTDRSVAHWLLQTLGEIKEAGR